MKKKIAKLSLHRETVRELISSELRQAPGALAPTDYGYACRDTQTCYTCQYRVCSDLCY